MPTWVRPYPRDGDNIRIVVAVGMSALGLAPLCGAVATGAYGYGVPVAALFVAVWEVVLWRVVLVGVYVSDRGIKIRMVLRTRVIAWARVRRAWAGPAAGVDAWQIWVAADEPERAFETPIWRQGSRARHRNRIVLPPELFTATLAALNPPLQDRCLG